MFNKQMKLQKFLGLGLLIVSAIFFIYAIGFMTDLYPLYLCQAYGGVSGASFFDKIQPYNNWLVALAIVTVLTSLLTFIFATNKRRKYYLDNFISSVVQIVVFVACSIFLIVGSTVTKNQFLTTVDVEAYIQKCADKGWSYSGTTIFFDLGYVVAGLLLIAAFMIFFNYYYKMKLIKKENELLEGNKNGK